jgi:putative inorganic carbon (HCO3(-)) transporter
MNNKNQTYKFYLIGFFSILALPLLTSPLLLSPSAWGKAILFRIIISVLIFFFAYLLLYKRIILFNWRKLSLPFWILITFFITLLLSTIFSLDPRFSFWGSPLRGDGFLNLGLIIIFSILTFLILKKSDWRKIWDFTILIGILVSIITFFQRFSLFSNIIKPFGSRPPGTMGGPIFLGLYFLLLVFITFSFFLEEKEKKKKIIYLLASLLFIYIIFLTESRAIYLGIIIGLIYFILCYPLKNKVILTIKFISLIILIIGACGIYYLVSHPKTTNSEITRFSVKLAREDPRFSAWIISIEAIKDHPILGYGPENFSIAFDRYYSPSLPFISKEWGSWYDRAHSFIFEIGITAGIPALIIYLLLFGSLFWQLQRKKESKDSNFLIIHGIQATLFAYLTANLFSFDVFSTYLIFYLIVAYSLSLINSTKEESIILTPQENLVENEFKPTKPLFISILFIALLCFIWFGCLKPLGINADINQADYYTRTNQCQKALKKMETNVLPTNSIIDSYAKLKYIEIIESCSQKITNLKTTSTFRTISLLKDVVEIRPYYTRAWIFLGRYSTILVENNIDHYFEKSLELSPKREEIFISWIQSYFASKEYQKAEEKSQQCIDLIPQSFYCHWLKGINNIYLDNIEQADKDISLATEMGYDPETYDSLSQLLKAYSLEKEKYYDRIITIYEKLLARDFRIVESFSKLVDICKETDNYNIINKWKKALINIYPELKPEIDKIYEN